jgi:prepilin-type N-terminal cleavage/methylation domain-containing protein
MIKKIFKKSRGLTLVEILVAVSLFSTVGLMALTVFINITRIQGRLSLENAISETLLLCIVQNYLFQ